MSETMSTSVASADTHPIGLIVTDDLQRNRLTVFFRLLLAIRISSSCFSGECSRS